MASDGTVSIYELRDGAPTISGEEQIRQAAEAIEYGKKSVGKPRYHWGADNLPMIGMLMIPKTCACVWTVLIGFFAMKRECK